MVGSLGCGRNASRHAKKRAPPTNVAKFSRSKCVPLPAPRRTARSAIEIIVVVDALALVVLLTAEDVVVVVKRTCRPIMLKARGRPEERLIMTNKHT